MSHKTKVKLEVPLPDSPIELINIGMALLGMAHTGKGKNSVVAEFAEDLFQAISAPLDADRQEWGGKLYSAEVRQYFDRWMNDREGGIREVLQRAADRIESLPPDDLDEPRKA